MNNDNQNTGDGQGAAPAVEKSVKQAGKGCRVGIFVPCCVDQFAAGTAKNMYAVLAKAHCDCHYPQEATCCGRELYHQGDRDGAKRLGEKMIELYEPFDYVVSCGSACVVYIQKHFSSLFHNTTLHNSYRPFVDKCYDFSDFLVNVVGYTPEGLDFPHSVALMDHCTTLRDYQSAAHPGRKGLHDEPRRLLAAVGGLRLVEMTQADVCCGYGGMFTNRFAPVSDSLARRKVDNALAAGAEYIVSTEMSCLLHLRSYVEKNRINLKCMHIADLLAGES